MDSPVRPEGLLRCQNALSATGGVLERPRRNNRTLCAATRPIPVPHFRQRAAKESLPYNRMNGTTQANVVRIMRPGLAILVVVALLCGREITFGTRCYVIGVTANRIVVGQ